MAWFDLELIGKVARLLAFAVGRFDPAFCGKAIRIAAALCVIEFLSTVVMVAVWVPADSECRSWQRPGLIDGLLFVSGGATLWVCILAILWKHVARLISAHLRTEGGQRGSVGLLFFCPIRFRVNTALLSAVFFGFAAFVAIPFFEIIRECGP
jgi:hypothetical protein